MDARSLDRISKLYAVQAVSKCTRSHNKLASTGTEPRPIFAAINYWPNTVNIIDAFHAKSIEDKSFKIAADYKYGPWPPNAITWP